MKHAHYCSFCRQWISEPHYLNVTYHLNERHPANETDCEYHTSVPWELPTGREKPVNHGVNAPQKRRESLFSSIPEFAGKNLQRPLKQSGSVIGQIVKIFCLLLGFWLFLTVFLPIFLFLLF